MYRGSLGKCQGYTVCKMVRFERQYVPMAVTLISYESWASYVMSVGFICKMKNKGIPLL